MARFTTPATLIAAFSIGAVTSKLPEPQIQNNQELQQMYNQDQADRQGDIEKLDWHKIIENDLAHQKRVAEMLQQDLVNSPTDYYNAAMIYQHASTPQGYKLAHELAMIAASMGHKNAKWLSAASWDRFLRSIKHNQRFGTQYYSEHGTNKFQLGETDKEVTDYMRKALRCPTLQQAKDRAKNF